MVSVLVFDPALAVRFRLFSLFELNGILIVVLGRTHFRSRLSFAGCARALPSAEVRDSRPMMEPNILG